jgi:hypothetical protein
LALRVFLALLLHFAVGEATFAPDQLTYHEGGVVLAQYWGGELVDPWPVRQAGRNGYFYVVAAQYLLFGTSSLVPKLVNALVGALTVSLLFDITVRVTGAPAVALRAARYAAYFPSLVLWSVLNIRDVWVVLLILVIAREALCLQEKFSAGGLIRLSLAVLALPQFRDYILLAVVAPVAASFLIRARGNVMRNAAFGLLLGLAIVMADRIVGGGRHPGTLDLEKISALRAGTATGASAIEPDADVSTLGRALVFLPKGLAYFLFGPFPWTIGNVRQASTLPEMLFLYALVPSIVTGIAHLIRHRLRDAVMVLLVTAALTFGYALGQANQGTAYRHRAQVLPFFLMFGALGVELRRKHARMADGRALQVDVARPYGNSR